MNNLTLEAWKEYVRRDGAGGYALASDYRGIAAKRRAETRLLSRAAGLDRYAASLEPAEDEKLPF